MKHNIAIIGLGRQGKRWHKVIKESFSRTDHNVVTVDPYNFQADYMFHYPSPLFPTIDGAIVATPLKTHYSLTKNLLNAGIPVMLEKPACESVLKLAELYRIAKDNNVPLCIGYLLRFHESNKLWNLPLGAKIDSAYYRRIVTGPIRKGESPIWHLAVHDIDLLYAKTKDSNLCLESPFSVRWEGKRSLRETYIYYSNGNWMKRTEKSKGVVQIELWDKGKRFSQEYQTDCLWEQFIYFLSLIRNEIPYCRFSNQNLIIESITEEIVKKDTHGNSSRNRNL